MNFLNSEQAWSNGSYEFLVLMSGLLPNPKLETSMMAIRCVHNVKNFFIGNENRNQTKGIGDFELEFLDQN